MKKFLTLLLLIIILFIFSYIFLYYFFNLAPKDNYFNKTFRPKIISNFFLRKIFKLHTIGDARYDYLKDDVFKSLMINVFNQEGETLTDETKNQLVSKISALIKKPDGITISEKTLEDPLPENVTDQDLINLLKIYQHNSNKKAQLNIFVLKKYEPHPTYTGLVIDAGSIFIFMDTVRDLSFYEKTTTSAEISALLHEFAHLLGAEHVEDNK